MRDDVDVWVGYLRWMALPHCIRIARIPFQAGWYWAEREARHEGLL